MSDGGSVSRRSLAEKVNHLFHTIHPSGRGEYSNEEVAAAIRGRGGPTISATYLWQLRKGVRENPTKKHLEALADFFGVPPAYFFDDDVTEHIDAELKLLAALRDSSVRQIALRAFGLSAESLSKIAEMVEWVRDLEALRDGKRSRLAEPPEGGLPRDDRD
ncbi:MAG TPA: helix-turn-helix domain-containing protein [Chloroflexota bacterium]|nr:helix-turn-helix domain-containing protein [Chloroflexota bacterium]